MTHSVRSAIEAFQRSDAFQSSVLVVQRRHKLILGLLEDEAGPTTPIARLTREHVDNVVFDRRVNGCATSTLNVYKSSLRVFGAWAVQNGLVKVDFANHLANKKAVTVRSKKQPLTADQLRQIIKLAYEHHHRDGMTVMLLACTGCRESEIAGLRWADVDLSSGVLYVFRSKVQDYHEIPCPPELVAALGEWKTWVEERYGEIQPSWYLVPARAHVGWIGFMNPDWPLAVERPQTKIRDRVKVLLGAVGADARGRGSHTMRRTAANLILEQTGDIRVAQALLGHASVTQTEQYLSIDAQKAKLRDAMKNWRIGDPEEKNKEDDEE
jgi:integrase/recombinase XerC